MSLRYSPGLYQNRGHVRTVAPASEPVTADELRTHLNETATGLPDAEANAYITEAREEIERASGIAIITQTWRLSLDYWPGAKDVWWDGVRQGHINMIHGPDNMGDVWLPAFPLQSVTSVTTYDEASNSTAVTVADVFDVDTYTYPGRLVLQRGQTWPIAMRAANAIEIVYVAGYGNSASNVPASIRRAVKQMAASIYSHRGDGCDMQSAYVSSGAAAIMDQYRIRQV